MRIFGYDISRTKAVPANLNPPDSGRGWISVVRDWFPGAWQANVEIRNDLVLAQATVFACMTLIANDIAKMRLRLMERIGQVWAETESAAFSPVLRKPNRFQTRQQFVETWILSKLSHGNTYVLKERDQRGVVVRLYVLDPSRVRPLIAPDGSVYYELQEDDLARVGELTAVPAIEVIHDRWNCLHHPLVGLSPIYACGLAATAALKIQQHSAKFFQNMARPSGILTAPGQIGDDVAQRLKDHWEKNYTGDNIGKVAVLGDGLKYEAMAVTAADAQLVAQLELSALQVCSVFHVPPHMVGAAPAPAYNNVEALNQQYYSQCLQTLIEAAEATIDEGLGLDKPIDGRRMGAEFDIDDLLRMDSATAIKSLNDAVGGGWMKPNEARQRRNLPPVTGGDTPYLQQQNYSLAALNKRDTAEDPFGSAAPAAPLEPAANDEEPDPERLEERSAFFAQELRKEFTHAVHR